MVNMPFQSATQEDQKYGTAGKSMAVGPSVKSAHNMFLDKYRKKAFQKIPKSGTRH